jgi:hypothetical protein
MGLRRECFDRFRQVACVSAQARGPELSNEAFASFSNALGRACVAYPVSEIAS